MRRTAMLGLAVAIAAVAPVSAQEAEGTGAAVHIVRPGETLWDLAGRYLSDPFRWREIFSLNRSVIRDPHWIYPQDRLLIPRGAWQGDPGPGPGPAAEGVSPGRTVFYIPDDDQRADGTLRMTSPAEVPAITAGSFYGAGILVREAELSPVGRIVEVVSPTVVPRLRSPQIQPYDRVYLRLTAAVAAGDRLHLMRTGRLVVPYGRVYASTGSALVLSVQGDVATVEVDRFYGEVRLGDLALPMPAFDARPGVLPVEAGGLEGVILEFAEPQPVPATEDLAFVNLGAASGVVEGDEFVAYLPASVAAWGVRPEILVARLQVIRAELLTSTVRVVGMEHPALAPGLPVRLVAKMPS